MSVEQIGAVIFCVFIFGVGILTAVNSGKTIIEDTKQGLKNKQTPLTKVIENSFNQNIYMHDKYIDGYGLVSKLQGKHFLIDANDNNNVAKDNNGNLHFVVKQVDMKPYVDEIESVKLAADSVGAKLLYVQTPVKLVEGYAAMPIGVRDYTKLNTDSLLAMLKERNIGVLDLRKSINEINLTHAFYTTDHHWQTKTAFWGVGKAAMILEEYYGINLYKRDKFTNIKYYDVTTYRDSFLGSQGRRVGRYYAGVDNYELITPTFETHYTVTIHKSNGAESHTKGSFNDCIVKKNFLEGDDISTNRYAAYFGGDYPMVDIGNNGIGNDTKILILKDSYALPFTAYLSTMVGKIKMIDKRYYKGSIEEVVKEYQPDIVMYVYKSINTQK